MQSNDAGSGITRSRGELVLEKGMDQKKLLKLLKDSGADMTQVKEWFRKLDRVRKLAPSVVGKYQSAFGSLQEGERICMRLDELLMADSFAIDKRSGELTVGTLYETGNRKEILSLMKELKKQRNRFDHIIVIQETDTQFHLIYDAVLKMGSAYTGAEGEQLIFQSEVENLLDLMRDCLRRRQPDFAAYTFYSLEHGEELLQELPPEECLGKIERVYRREFTGVMERILVEKLGEEAEGAKKFVEELCRVA